MYTVFIRPLLEYAAVVWNGCSQSEVEKLEKVQLCTTRVVTGLPIVASPNICPKLFPTQEKTSLHTEPKNEIILYQNVDQMHLRNLSFPIQFIYGIL